jgi:4-hydroxy-tetrahydrodipicolinate reductase
MRAALVGYGRMGRAIEEVLGERGHAVVARIGRGGDLREARRADVAFEFSTPESAGNNVAGLIGGGIPTVCGTTGWEPEAARRASEAARVPLLVAPNFSIGVAVLKRLVEEASRLLAPFPEFEAGIFERHHSRKADVPSGTARLLAAAASGAGPGGTRVASLRQGGQPGEHQVYFEGPEESLELVHRARSRRLFAAGAVRAAEWILQTKPTGFLTFDDFFERSGS